MSRAFVAAVTVAWLFACEPGITTPPAHPRPDASASPPPASALVTPRILVGTDLERCHAGIAKTILGAFRETVRVTAHVTRQHPELDAFATRVEKLFQGIGALAPGKVELAMIEIDSAEEMKAAKEAGIGEVALEGHATGYAGLVLEDAGQRVVLSMGDADAQLEPQVASKLRELFYAAEGNAPTVGVVGGKREIAIADRALVSSERPFCGLVAVDLAGEIDPDLDGLIITQPGVRYTDDELRRIDRFVMKGRALAVFASAVNTRPFDTKMKVLLHARGLDKLLAGYGVEMERATVRDAKLAFSSAAPDKTELFAPAVLMVPHVDGGPADIQTLDDTFPLFFRSREVAFPMASPLVLHPDRQPGAILRVVARSSAAATADTTRRQRLRPDRDVTVVGPAAPRTLAVEITGPLKSAFGDGVSSGSPRVVVVASAQFLANPFARAGSARKHTDGDTGNALLQQLAREYARRAMTSAVLRNTLDWMTTDELVIACNALAR